MPSSLEALDEALPYYDSYCAILYSLCVVLPDNEPEVPLYPLGYVACPTGAPWSQDLGLGIWATACIGSPVLYFLLPSC